jgi:hypothetical protein
MLHGMVDNNVDKEWCVVTTFFIELGKKNWACPSFPVEAMQLKSIHGLMSANIDLFNNTTLLEKIVRSITLIMFQQFCVSL